MTEQEEFRLWMRKIKDFDGGLLGFIVVLITLTATAFGGWYGIVLFTTGTYPKIILAVPGLVAGFFAFIVSAKTTFKYRK